MQSTPQLKRCASIACILAIGLLFFAAPAHGTPLNLSSSHPGDVTTHYTDVQYVLDANPNTGTLTAVGYPDEFDVNTQGFNSSSFSLSMTVMRSTGALVGGSVTITGDTDGTPHYNGTLLTGNIIAFGFHDPPLATPAVGNIFEFVFHVTGGLLLAPYYSSTNTAGIIMNIANGSASPSFTGSFTTAFHNNPDSGFSDTFPTENPNVPEPSTFVLLGLGTLPLAWRLRRRGVHPA
jgi:hypothetical protein